MKRLLKKKRFYIILLCFALFLLIAILILKKGILDIDKHSYDFIKNNFINDNTTPYIEVFTNLGGALVLVGVSLMIGAIIRNKKISIAILVNLLLATLLNLATKAVFQRERPNISNWLVNELGYSFPSGHSSVSMAYYGFLIYLVYKKIKNTKLKWFAITILSIIILFVGISRIYLGVHYLSDVLGGFLFSIIYLIIFVYFYEKIFYFINDN